MNWWSRSLTDYWRLPPISATSWTSTSSTTSLSPWARPWRWSYSKFDGVGDKHTHTHTHTQRDQSMVIVCSLMPDQSAGVQAAGETCEGRADRALEEDSEDPGGPERAAEQGDHDL